MAAFDSHPTIPPGLRGGKIRGGITEMFMNKWIIGSVCFVSILCGAPAAAPDQTGLQERAAGDAPMNFQHLAEYNVTWDQPGRNSADSMPLGNGDVGLNVWTEGNGDLVFYIGKNDAWSEDIKSRFGGAKGLLKLGRVRVSLSPNPFVDTPTFSQTLVLEEGSILLKSQAADGESRMRIWVDANRPVIHVDVKCDDPVKIRVALESWRQEKTEHLGVDTILDNQTNRIAWFYRNANREIPAYMDRTFGGVIEGKGLVSLDSNTLESQAGKTHHASIHTLTAQSPTPQEWLSTLNSQIEKTNSLSYDQAWKEHVAWWEQFWNRSWIFVSGNEDAITATRGYILQRFKNACSSRGDYPIKFNGSIFNVDNPAFKVNDRSVDTFPVDADFRKWGYQYWFQNTRCIYWPMLVSGDFDLMKPLFQMYRDMIEGNAEQVRAYYGHGGAYIQETSPSWGGLRKIDKDTTAGHTGRYYQSILELSAMMIDYYAFTQDKEFVRETLLPVADAGVTFYAEHFPRTTEGELRIEPANSLETYWNVTNPLPDLAGLRWVLKGLLALPSDLTTPESLQRWQNYLDALPPIPVGTRRGKETLLPFETFTEGYKRNNGENPSLYAVHPYRFYGIGKPDISRARAAFELRIVKRSGCWSQDGVQAAYLGDTKTARENLIFNFSRSEPRLKFPAFWRQGFDYTPDEDNGGNGVHMLQLMLIQSDAGVIRLLPAWPKEWDADFKLNAPGKTSVEGRVRSGTLHDLRVTPESRRTDIIVIGEADPEPKMPTLSTYAPP